jgi:hypothetical protein
MSDIDKSNFLRAAITDAEDFIDSTIAPDREKATRFYKGDPFGNEEDGRSQIVMSEVRDVVQAMMPSLLRVFLSTDSPVEFKPRRADTVEFAEQATETVNYIFYEENNGAMILHDAFKDALVRKTGFVKFWCEEKTVVTEEHFAGLSEEQVALLQEDPELEFDEAELEVELNLETKEPEFSFTAKRKTKERCYHVEAVPPEEIIISRNARNLHRSDYTGHRTTKKVSDLVAEGYDKDEIMAHGQPVPSFDFNSEAFARNPALRTRSFTASTNLDPSMLEVPYFESWVRMDADGDGIAELHRICSIGDGGHVLHDEIIPDVPLAIFCPDPEPHTVIGQGMADQTSDLQLIKSNIVRGMLDSLAQSIFPTMAVIEGQVNLDDAMNTEIGRIIRTRMPGAVQPLETPFVGGQALTILAYLDDVRAQRTGISRATQGLDADVLQSTTKAAVDATVQAAQERLELVARIFAEGGMRQLFKGLLKLIVRNQDKTMVIRLRQKWVEVDPRAWNADMDVRVNVGLGTGDKMEKIAVLSNVLAQQKEALATLGPNNPLVDMQMMRDTAAEILSLSGFKDTATYWKEVTPDSMKAYQDMMAKNQKPSVEEILADVEKMKVMADIKMNKDKMRLEFIKAQLEDDRERDKAEADTLLRAAEIELKYESAESERTIKTTLADINAKSSRDRMVLDTAFKLSVAEADSNDIAEEREAAKQAAQQQAVAAQQQPTGGEPV